MNIFEQILSSLPNGQVISVNIGLYWTAVMVDTDNGLKCGLASTLTNVDSIYHRLPAVAKAGSLERLPAGELAQWVLSKSQTETSVGLATVNALLPLVPDLVELPAEDYIVREGSNSNVAVIGHFPFVSQIKDQVKNLWVLELNPQEDDLPASASPEIIPQADILAITASTLINHTLEGILALQKPGATVLLLGPSTPLSPMLFQNGIRVLSGSIVEDPEKVLPMVRQGATFRQIRDQGVRRVTLEAPHPTPDRSSR